MNAADEPVSGPEGSDVAELLEAPRPREPSRHARPTTDSMADGVRSRTTYAVSLEMFEGPLDLLLHLVRRHELDILDIPISFVTEKYIEYISLRALARHRDRRRVPADGGDAGVPQEPRAAADDPG